MSLNCLFVFILDIKVIGLFFVWVLCYFRVVALSMSPVDDTFISGSLDKTIRLWDLRSPNCQVSSFLFWVRVFIVSVYLILIMVVFTGPNAPARETCVLI